MASNLKAAIFIDAVDFTTGAILCCFGKIAKNLGKEVQRGGRFSHGRQNMSNIRDVDRLIIGKFL